MLIDFYSEEVCRVWLVLDKDFRPTRARVQDTIGTPPEWYEYLKRKCRWGLEWVLFCIESAVADALEEGLVYGQPFLVELKPPRTTQHWSAWGYEYDEHYVWSILRVVPLKPEKVAARLEEWLNRK